MKSDSFLSRPERRNHVRVDVNMDVDLMIDGRKIKSTASNISCGGLFLPISKERLKESTNVEVILNLPDTEKAVKVVGEVNRFQERSFLKRKTSGVAIQFQGLYDDNILAIDRFIKSKVH